MADEIVALDLDELARLAKEITPSLPGFRADVEENDFGRWKGVRDDRSGICRITNPAGLEYEFSESELARTDRRTLALLNDMLDGLIELQNENDALRARDALRDRAEGQAAFDVVAQLEAAKAERAADKAGFEAVIRELRGEGSIMESAILGLQEKIAGCTADVSKARVIIVGLEEDLRRANMTIGDERGYVQTERRITMKALEENRQLKAEIAALAQARL